MKKKVTVAEMSKTVKDYMNGDECKACFVVFCKDVSNLYSGMQGNGKDLIAMLGGAMYRDRDFLEIASKAVEIAKKIIKQHNNEEQ